MTILTHTRKMIHSQKGGGAACKYLAPVTYTACANAIWPEGAKKREYNVAQGGSGRPIPLPMLDSWHTAAEMEPSAAFLRAQVNLSTGSSF